MNVLFVTTNPPDRIRTRPFHWIRALRRAGCRVALATVWNGPEERESVERLRGEVDELYCEHLTFGRSLLNCAVAAPMRRPMQYRYSWSPALADRLWRLVAGGAFDVVHAEHLRGARYGLHAQEAARSSDVRTPVVWDSVDCISSLFRQTRERGATWTSRLISEVELAPTQRCEAWLTTRFPRVLVTSAKDRDALLDLLRDRGGDPDFDEGRVSVVPNGVDAEYFAPKGSVESLDPDAVVISGKMSYHANEAAVLHFAERVMPRIWAVRPRTKLWIVGKGPGRRIRRLAELRRSSDSGRVVVTGAVPDLRPYLRRAAVAAAPLVYGVGIQNKVLEAMACGTAVAASPSAASAIGAAPGRDLVVADGEEETAREIVALLDDRSRRDAMGASARRFVTERHDWSQGAARLIETYRSAWRTHAEGR